MKWKRPLYLFHRWAGIALCLLFVLWFASGIFMMYVEFPQLTRSERLAGSAGLDFSAAQLTPGAAVARLKAGDFDTAGAPDRNRPLPIGQAQAALEKITSLRLAMLLGHPLYIVQAAGPAQPRAVRADTGELLVTVDAETALRSAADFVARAYPGLHTRLRYLDTVQADQWSVSAGLDAHRPLHLIALGDDAGTELYVSSTTGEVVRDSQRIERLLNYPGAVTHWLYPTVIRRYPDAWSWMVDVLSTAGCLFAVSGIWVGLLRWRKRRKPGQWITPHRGLLRWHHLAGLAFGLSTLTWVSSGLLSMNPGKLNPSRSPADGESLVYSGKPLTPADFTQPSFAGEGVIEAESLHWQGQPYWLTARRDGSRQLLPGAPTASNTPLPTVASMQALATGLLPGQPLLQTQVLREYDEYWYSRNPGNGTRPLPMLRVQFGDPAQTWFHLNPATGQILERSTRTNRLYRWLYNGLHSWDFRWLRERRPLWDITVIVFSLGGLALSMTGLIVGVRRLRY